ncbi:germin-like protein 9-3 [Olea europaea var. sylvestris]|uniref:germin-like protein 9-3 n=1 Tax=Olea europaea var. sylvestris TaxID=158386 RepID=UPI000C1CF646|nr:germin-like protein 9-3 [Olea europaea var. sylvestris]
MALLPSILFFLAVTLVTLQVALAGDADILSDFIPPSNTTVPPDGSFFTYTGLRAATVPNMPPDFKVFKASMAEFPALNGQSVSFAVLMYPPGTVNPPHNHPRASELLFLLVGSLEVGFVTTTNDLFNQTLQEGDIFVFPKGLVHFQYNRDEKAPAIAVSAFGSASAGTVSIPSAVFNTSIYDPVLAASFKTDVVTIKRLKYGLSH